MNRHAHIRLVTLGALAALVMAFVGTVLHSPASADTDTPAYTVAYIDSVLELYPIKPKQQFTSVDLVSDSTSSVHLNQLRSKLAMHTTPASDETIYVIRGVMRVRIGNEKRTVGAGTLYHFSAGTPRELFNMGRKPVIYLSMMAPAFGSPGRVMLDE